MSSSKPSKIIMPYTLASSLGIAVVTIILTLKVTKKTSKHGVAQSPLDTIIPTLNQQQILELDYPPDLLPGGRNIETPHGSCRVYEFGPEDGPKILFIHGISVPIVGLADLARHFAGKGCRVMLFDLYGRGYTPNPGRPQTSSLFMTQTLSVLASSPIAWTGKNAFSLIGYSMGGALGVEFSALFPSLVKSLVLIAPAGLNRAERLKKQQQPLALMKYALPRPVFQKIMKRMVSRQKPKIDADPKPGQLAVAKIYNAVKWQVDNHPGFIDAFVDSVIEAPLSGRQESWMKLRDHYGSNSNETNSTDNNSSRQKLILFLAEGDEQIIRNEVEADIKEAVGEENINLHIFPGGHELPIAMAEEVANKIWQIWENTNIVQHRTSTVSGQSLNWPARSDSLRQTVN